MQAYELTYQMQEGIEFESSSVSESYKASITNDATVSMNADINVTTTVPCNAQESESGVALWQWFVQQGDPEKQWSMVMTPQYYCRYGELANVAPACPWPACDNGDCSVCKTDWNSSSSVAEEFLQ